jgi:hypothetical protein
LAVAFAFVNATKASGLGNIIVAISIVSTFALIVVLVRLPACPPRVRAPLVSCAWARRTRGV